MNDDATRKRCPDCMIDPDPRGWSACSWCRGVNHTAPQYVDLTDAHVERVMQHLIRVFDAATVGKRRQPPFVDGWKDLARAVIRLGAVAPEEKKP